MNAEQLHKRLPAENVAATPGQDLETALSAMVDGELSASELDALLESLPSGSLANWHAYEVIGDVLRGHADPTGIQPAADFLAAVRIGLGASNTEVQEAPRPVVEAARVLSGGERREAANDAVFRWKLVAGFASLAAVMAVSWSMISGSGSTGAAGAQLASGSTGSTSAPVLVSTVGAPAANSPVAVNTGQGVLIRDAQLEALLAEHRQHGGMSALQMPSGFIRNATYEAAGR